MALTARIALAGPLATGPEDVLASCLGVIFPDDVTNQHGDAEHQNLIYTSPHLPWPLRLRLADVTADQDRRLFSHYLWNASLLLAELIEAETLGLSDGRPTATEDRVDLPVEHFDVTGLATVELGAGTGLPSLVAALLGAREVLVTDYPSDAVLAALQETVHDCVGHETEHTPTVRVEGHAWGDLDSPLAMASRGRFDRVLAADTLWMPWQHDSLRKSMAYFLSDHSGARAWVVAGFHTGRATVAAFFEADALAAAGLCIERIWERDCDGVERLWVPDRGVEDVTERKRWLVVAVLRNIIPALV